MGHAAVCTQERRLRIEKKKWMWQGRKKEEVEPQSRTSRVS